MEEGTDEDSSIMEPGEKKELCPVCGAHIGYFRYGSEESETSMEDALNMGWDDMVARKNLEMSKEGFDKMDID